MVCQVCFNYIPLLAAHIQETLHSLWHPCCCCFGEVEKQMLVIFLDKNEINPINKKNGQSQGCSEGSFYKPDGKSQVKWSMSRDFYPFLNRRKRFNGMPRMCGDIAMNESSLVNAGCIFNGQKITNKRSKKQTKNKV